MKEKFDKKALLGATRQVLFQVADWSGSLYDPGAPERLIGKLTKSGAEAAQDWEVSGSAGPFVERSTVVGHMGRVIDFLNSNAWPGDPSNLWSTLHELMAFYGVLQSSSAFINEVDNAINPDAVSALFPVLEVFFARVNLELDDQALELRELAAIAGLAEKTVRMAAVGRDKNPDLVTFKEGSRTFVTPQEARRWLAKKNIDYRPIDWSEERSLPPVDPKDLNELGPYLRNLREKADVTVPELGTRLGWDDSTVEAYKSTEESAADPDVSRFSIDVLVQLSQILCPEQSSELVRIIDRVIHPRLLEMQISKRMPASAGL